MSARRTEKASPLFEIARLFVHLDHYQKAARFGKIVWLLLVIILGRVDSLLNHYVINHTRIACVYVNNTHASAGFDRRSDGYTRLVHNVTGPSDKICARFIRTVLANNQRFDRLITGGRALLSRHRDGRSGYRY